MEDEIEKIKEKIDKEAGIKTTAVVLKEKTTILVVSLQLFALLVLALL